MQKQYIEYFYPGSFVSESSVQEVADRTPPAEFPNGAYGYRFFARSEVMQDGEVLRGQPKDYSGTTYFGEAMTLEEVKSLAPESNYKILISNMECNGWGRVVRTIRGQFMPLNEGDLVVTPNLIWGAGLPDNIPACSLTFRRHLARSRLQAGLSRLCCIFIQH